MTPLTEHIGSLLRPTRLLEARRDANADKLDSAGLRAVEDDAILEALRRQQDIGIDVVGDGEFRRTDFRTGLANAIAGLEQRTLVGAQTEGRWTSADSETVTARTWQVTGRVSRTAPIATDEALFMRENTSIPFKITLPSPGYVAERFGRNSTDSPYGSTEELAQAITEILVAEIRELVELGVPYVQLDNPGYTTYVDQAARERIVANGGDPDADFRAMLQADIDLLNRVPRDSVTLGLHLCRGNNASAWQHEGSYAPIAHELFSSLPVDRLLLEFDDARSGGFEVLGFIPAGKVAVLGLISSKVSDVETSDGLMRRLDEAAKFIDPAQLAISPQCGFATHAEGGNHLSEDDQYRKLAVAVETARRWFS
jgi:5-methyltetrahydropteroyltriglutamate--homocysteine methyltransferase